MEIRRDFVSVETYIARLLAIGGEFNGYDGEWIHLKNEEDFRFIFRIPERVRYKVEIVYSTGRDMAGFMAGELRAVNSDIGNYPTLTSVIDRFKDTWVYGCYDSSIPDVAKAICEEHSVNLWSVSQMVLLFRKQERLLSAVRGTLKILEETELYKLENGISIVKQHEFFSLGNINSSNVIINSDGARASIETNYNEPKVFSEMLEVIGASQLAEGEKRELSDSVNALAASHKGGSFKDAYKDFMSNASAHVTLFTALLPALVSLL